jgi:hypothetical protein
MCMCVRVYAYKLGLNLKLNNIYVKITVVFTVISIHLYTENLHLILSGYMPISMVKSCISIHFSHAHLTYKALTSTYILYACIRVVNVYLCVHVHVHTRMHICLIHNTHLPIACIRVLYTFHSCLKLFLKRFRRKLYM